MESKDTVTENTMKWSPIPLLINDLKHQLARHKKGQENTINKMLFERSYAASTKYDGTNVGKDEFDVMYGRNQTIASKTASYQKTTLEGVKKLDVKSIKTEVCTMAGISEENIACFNVYGELMCNSGMYNYTTDKLDKTHQLFGVMMRLANADVVQDTADKFSAAGFAVTIKKPGDDNEDGAEEAIEGEEGADGEGAECNIKIAMFMNETLQKVFEKLNAPMVTLAGTYANFYELVVANLDWMKKGMGEGLVLASPANGQCHINKWKIGAEASGDNLSALENLLQAIDEDSENKIIAAENVAKAKELIGYMMEVNSSKLINGEIPQPKKPAKEEKKQKPAKKDNSVALTEDEQKEYDEAIKSAKSKFDHADTFFGKGMKGTMEYSALIAKECLADIKIDESDKAAMDKHNKYIQQVFKEEFIAFNKAKAAKK